MVFGNEAHPALVHKRAKQKGTAYHAIARYPCPVGKLPISKVHVARISTNSLAHANAIAGIPFSTYDKASSRIGDILLDHRVIECETARAKNDPFVGFDVIGPPLLLGLYSDHSARFWMHDKTFSRCFVENFRG